VTCNKCSQWKEGVAPQGRCAHLNTMTTAWTHCSGFHRRHPDDLRYKTALQETYLVAHK
jgi:hypothetical protein